MMYFMSNLLHISFKAVSTTLLSADVEVLSTADAIVACVSSCSCFIMQFSLVLLIVGLAKRILCNAILNQIMTKVQNIVRI